jgi:integrase
MARGKLPIYERRADDGRLLGYQVKIRRKGWQPVIKQFGEASMTEAQARKAAEKFAIDTLAQMERGTFTDRREIESVTLEEALDRYDREIGPTKKRPDGVSAYARRWKQQALAQHTIASLRPTDFAKYRDERLALGLSGNSVRLELGFVRHLYTIGIKEWGWPVTNPIQSIRMPKVAPGRDRRLSMQRDENGKTEEDRLMDAIAQTKRSKWLGQVVQVALASGMRQGEILGLCWRYVDFDRLTIHIPDTKTDTPRTVPIAPVTYETLWNVGAANGTEGVVFPVGSMSITHGFERACRRANIEGLRFHDLRHEATSRLFERGLGIQEVAAITGHKTLQMLKRYTHLRAEDLARKLRD